MVPLLVALVFHEKKCALSFLVTVFICAVPGFIIYSRRSLSFQENKLKLRYSYLIVTSAWIIASVVGSLPFMISGSIPEIHSRMLCPSSRNACRYRDVNFSGLCIT